MVERAGAEYRLTPAGEELRPVLELMGVWGQRWARGDVEARHDDASLLMWDIRRNVDAARVPARPGRVFVDWSQNDPGKSTVAPYSLRGLPVPTVSTPVAWDEVEAVADGGDARPLRFGPDDVLARLDAVGDLFAAVASGDQRLPIAG